MKRVYPCGAEASGGLLSLPDVCPFHGTHCDTVSNLVGKLVAALEQLRHLGHEAKQIADTIHSQEKQK